MVSAHAHRASPLLSHAELERAARLLMVRSRREASSAFAGSYRSAFRGGGVEFEESRPYVPGDDVRSIDWNALARTDIPYVKRFREERDQTVVLAMDTSGSMGFGGSGSSNAAAAARVAGLLTAAATRAGDRVGLVCFDSRVREEIGPGRGEGHSWRILSALVRAAGDSRGQTALESAVARIRASVRRRSIVFLISDFRDDAFFAPIPARDSGRGALVALAAAHDVVAILVHDPRETEIPPVGTVRLQDPEQPGRTLVFSSRRRRARERYRAACAVRRRALSRRLRADGLDVLELCSNREPLRALTRFFESHVGSRARRAP